MFGRTRNSTAEPVAAQGEQGEQADDVSVGKGRATPKRRDAEQKNRRPIVQGNALPANATKEQRKAAKQARREEAAKARALQRQALETGDEAHLPARDRGPARRWVRNYVDARRSVGEYFLPVSMLVLGMSMVPNPSIKIGAVIVLYALLLGVIVDSLLLRRKLSRETEARFGDKAHGAAGYGMMRALQFRRLRLPKPQVQRGQFPT